MHDCRQTQDSLIDLLFDERDGATRARLVAEVERCAACAAEYRSLAATLEACDEASGALAPGENYWPQYHAALARRLHAAEGATRAADELHAPPVTTTGTNSFRKRAFWKRALTASIRMPVPVATAAALVVVAACTFALMLAARPAPEPVVLAAPHTFEPQGAPQFKFIEVPVVQEKVVQQIVYVPRRAGDVRDDARRSAARENLAGVGRQNTSAAAPNATASPSRANLSGFKPAGEVNLRIIKGSDAREQ